MLSYSNWLELRDLTLLVSNSDGLITSVLFRSFSLSTLSSSRGFLDQFRPDSSSDSSEVVPSSSPKSKSTRSGFLRKSCLDNSSRVLISLSLAFLSFFFLSLAFFLSAFFTSASGRPGIFCFSRGLPLSALASSVFSLVSFSAAEVSLCGV